jgi:hypothetical protein
MADFTQDKKYNYNWQYSKFKDFVVSGSNVSQFINDAGYITIDDVPPSSGSVATGSLLTTASFSDPNITFVKGNGGSFDVNISSLTVTNAATASYINGGTF